MAESRAKRLQVVAYLAERNEQEAARQLNRQQLQVSVEEQQLRELDAYAAQYLHTYSARKVDVRPHELIAFSGFIQRLGEACKEQQAKLERLYKVRDTLQQIWQRAHHKHESIKELILRLAREENLLVDKRVQKELDELVSQQYSRKDA
jgi:flagellar protein FliJ